MESIAKTFNRANEDDEALTPADIARLLALLDQVEPFDMTDAESAAWEADRQARKEFDKAQFAEHADQLRSMWE